MTVQTNLLISNVIAAASRVASEATERVCAFRDDRSGTTAIEYALLATGIAVVIIGTAFALGETVNTAFETVAVALQAAAST